MITSQPSYIQLQCNSCCILEPETLNDQGNINYIQRVVLNSCNQLPCRSSFQWVFGVGNLIRLDAATTLAVGTNVLFKKMWHDFKSSSPFQCNTIHAEAGKSIQGRLRCKHAITDMTMSWAIGHQCVSTAFAFSKHMQQRSSRGLCVMDHTFSIVTYCSSISISACSCCPSPFAGLMLGISCNQTMKPH